MIRLERSFNAWGSSDFEAVLKAEVTELGVDQLPLQQGLVYSSHVADGSITLVVHTTTEMEATLCIKAGIFYQGSIGGCGCADDPTPGGENNEYCEVRIKIDKKTALATIELAEE
jgi:hypothetical protein